MSVNVESPLHRLSALGQSVWIDFLSRESIRGGHLQRLIDDDVVVGATSNPTIFQKAMAAGNAYDEQLRKEIGRGSTVREAFWALAERDIKDACDLFAPVFTAGNGRDGFVSLEVDPGLAYDTLATFREAMRLHESVERPNLMVKIPATKPGLAAIEDVIAKGKSINVTLIFSLRATPRSPSPTSAAWSAWSPRAATRPRCSPWPASSSRGSTPRPTGAWMNWMDRTPPTRVGCGRAGISKI